MPASDHQNEEQGSRPHLGEDLISTVDYSQVDHSQENLAELQPVGCSEGLEAKREINLAFI